MVGGNVVKMTVSCVYYIYRDSFTYKGDKLYSECVCVCVCL